MQTSLIRPALILFAIMTLLTGIIYPLLVTGIARLIFPYQAAGSLLLREGQPIGSRLIGQSFSDPKYFWGRPSATTPQPYNGAASGGSNLGPLNPALVAAARARVTALREADPDNTALVPVDLATASGSGLDPHISVAAAQYQASRIARVRGVPLAAVRTLIAAHTQGRFLGIVGEPRINVLELNLALDELRAGHSQAPPPQAANLQ